MAERGLHYGYTQLSMEAPKMTAGLWEFAQDYVYTHFFEEEQARAERNQVRMREWLSTQPLFLHTECHLPVLQALLTLYPRPHSPSKRAGGPRFSAILIITIALV